MPTTTWNMVVVRPLYQVPAREGKAMELLNDNRPQATLITKCSRQKVAAIVFFALSFVAHLSMCAVFGKPATHAKCQGAGAGAHPTVAVLLGCSISNQRQLEWRRQEPETGRNNTTFWSRHADLHVRRSRSDQARVPRWRSPLLLPWGISPVYCCADHQICSVQYRRSGRAHGCW